MAAPLTNAKVGTGRSMIAAYAAWPARATCSACARSRSIGTPVRSAPTAKMNGLPVMATAWISPASARVRSVSTVACSPAMVAGPKVLGLVWSNPLSRVSRAIVPAPPGRATSWTGVCVTTSSGSAAARVRASVAVFSVIAQRSLP